MPSSVTSVALYGGKPASLHDLLTGVQGLIAVELGDAFRPYSREQIHATIMSLDGIVDASSGELVNRHFLELTGRRRAMDHRGALEILADRLTPAMTVRFGGFRAGAPAGFTSRGRQPYERGFSIIGDSLVLMGWPLETVQRGDARRPLDGVRRALNEAGFLHRYHETPDDIDNDFYLVVGHHHRASVEELRRAAASVRAYLAVRPTEVSIGAAQIRIVAAETTSLATPTFIGPLSTDAEAVAALYR